ncbi:hypothetical protein [Acetobacter nitrogenifigens]
MAAGAGSATFVLLDATLARVLAAGAAFFAVVFAETSLDSAKAAWAVSLADFLAIFRLPFKSHDVPQV